LAGERALASHTALPCLAALSFLVLLAATARAADPPITALAFTPDGKSVVVGSAAGAQVRSWPALEVVKRIPTELPHVHDIAFSPSGDRLALAGGSPAESGTVEVFTWPEFKFVWREAPHTDVVYSLAWTSDGKMLATASLDKNLCLLEAASGKTRHTLAGHSRGVTAAAFLSEHSKEPYVVSASLDQSLRVWSADSGELKRGLENHTRGVLGLAVRPGQKGDGPAVVASIGEDRTVRFWQPTIGRMMRFARLDAAPLSLAWIDEARLAVGCADGKVRLIDLQTATIDAEIPALDGWAYAIAVAPGGKELLVGGGGGTLKRVTLPERSEK
jgi:WD40 repeat protein